MENKNQTSNRTEVEPAAKEEITPKFQHLAPALHAGDAGLPGDKLVTVIVPRAFNNPLSDGTRQRVAFTPGTYDIPERFLKHYYLKANGVMVPTERTIEKPEVEKGFDRSIVTPDYLEQVDKFDQLKALFAAVGGDLILVKGNTSKADLRTMILDKIKTDAEAASK